MVGLEIVMKISEMSMGIEEVCLPGAKIPKMSMGARQPGKRGSVSAGCENPENEYGNPQCLLYEPVFSTLN